MASTTSLTLLFFPFLLLTLSHAATFDVVNQCSYTVWAAWADLANAGGGQQLNQGETWTVTVNPGTAAARIWARTGCSFDANGNGHCQTGDCGKLACTSYGSPPNTLAEFALNQYQNLDFIDISLVQGFNVPMDFRSTSSSCSQDIQCTADVVGQCPRAVEIVGRGGVAGAGARKTIPTAGPWLPAFMAGRSAESVALPLYKSLSFPSRKTTPTSSHYSPPPVVPEPLPSLFLFLSPLWWPTYRQSSPNCRSPFSSL